MESAFKFIQGISAAFRFGIILDHHLNSGPLDISAAIGGIDQKHSILLVDVAHAAE